MNPVDKVVSLPYFLPDTYLTGNIVEAPLPTFTASETACLLTYTLDVKRKDLDGIITISVNKWHLDSLTTPTKVWVGTSAKSPGWNRAFYENTVKVTATANGVSETYTLLRNVDPCTPSSIEKPNNTPVIYIKTGNLLTVSEIIKTFRVKTENPDPAYIYEDRCSPFEYSIE
jgi:hypothetical protein